MNKQNDISYENWPESYDVIVAGGGITGCCAALAAARESCRVVLIEKHPFLGGNMSGGLPWLGFHVPKTGEQVVKGLPFEIIQEMQKRGYATSFVPDPIAGSGVGVNGQMLKIVLGKMAKDAEVELIFHSIISGAFMEGQKIAGLFIQNKQGRQLIKAKVVIDCTDSADVCQFAGAHSILGRETDGKRQVSSNVIIFGDIDFPAMLDYFAANSGQIRPFPLSDKEEKSLLDQMRGSPLFVLGAFENIIKKARGEGIQYPRKQLIGVAYPNQRELLLVSSRVEDVDPNDIQNHSRAEIDGLLQTFEIEMLLHAYIPGCAKARLVSMGTQLGLREVRHVEGEYTLNTEDLLKPAEFSDSIARGAYHLDIHSPDNDGLAARRQPPLYQIPYRCLVVKGIDGLLVAGRGISATHEALSSTRVAPICGALGEAAGTAAAAAVKSGKGLDKINISELRQLLKKANCLI